MYKRNTPCIACTLKEIAEYHGLYYVIVSRAVKN